MPPIFVWQLPYPATRFHHHLCYKLLIDSNLFYFSAIDASDAKTNETSSSVDSQLKDESFRRRHSSEGVDIKFGGGSTLGSMNTVWEFDSVPHKV